MKKSAKRKRTSIRKDRVIVDHADDCMEYRKSWSEYVCEVDSLLKRDPKVKQWIDKATNGGMCNKFDIHHIWHRSTNVPQTGWFCSLVHVNSACHKYGHDVNPNDLEICSIAAKWERQKRHEQLVLIELEPEVLPPHLQHWNLEAMGIACGNDSLAGRIEAILIPKCSSVVFQRFGYRLLEIIETGR